MFDTNMEMKPDTGSGHVTLFRQMSASGDDAWVSAGGLRVIHTSITSITISRRLC